MRWTLVVVVVVVVVAVVVLGLLAAVGWSWRSHPTAFYAYHEELDDGPGGTYELSHGPYRVEVAEPQVRSGTARIDEIDSPGCQRASTRTWTSRRSSPV